MPVLEQTKAPLVSNLKPVSTPDIKPSNADEPGMVVLPIAGTIQAIFVNEGVITPMPLPDLED
jgi:hypothetical protein